MNLSIILVIGIILLGAIALIGFFVTKANGFGKYTTSTLILLVSLVLCALLYAGDHLDAQLFGHALMAIIGFAGGLIVAKD